VGLLKLATNYLVDTVILRNLWAYTESISIGPFFGGRAAAII